MKYLFVGGLARSGTSALCELLNGHSKISIGMERYKYSATSGKLFENGPELFTREKFFDWKDDETNIPVTAGKYAEMYSALASKYEETIYKGDKLPGYYRMVDKLLQSFPDAKIVLIWRPLLDVAMSWQRRSVDNTSWPAENDAFKAIARAKKDVQIIIKAAERHSDNLRIVGYESIFGSSKESAVSLIDWLGLDSNDKSFLTSLERLQKKSIKIANNRESVWPELEKAYYSDPQLVEIGKKVKELQEK